MAGTQRVLGSAMRALYANRALGARVARAPPPAAFTPAQWGVHPVAAMPTPPMAVCDAFLPMWGSEAPLGIFAPGTGAPPVFAIKRQYQPSNVRRKRKHGFLQRAKSRGGRAVLKRRREKGRWRLAC